MKKYFVKKTGIIIAALFIIIFLASCTILAKPVLKAGSSPESSINPSTDTDALTVITGDTPVKRGDKLDIPEIGLKENSYAEDVKDDDVTGDGVADMVILSGVRQNQEDAYSSELTVIVYDPAAKKYSSISAGEEGGYGGRLFTGDIDGDKVPDILVGAGTGGSGGSSNYSIVSFLGGVPHVLAKQDVLSNGAAFEGHFRDGFKVEIKNIDLNKEYVIDVSSDKETLIENGIYDASGKLPRDVETTTDNLVELNPIDTDGDGVYELQGRQYIWGFSHPDTIAEVDTLWKFDKGSLKLKSLDMVPIRS